MNDGTCVKAMDFHEPAEPVAMFVGSHLTETSTSTPGVALFAALAMSSQLLRFWSWSPVVWSRVGASERTVAWSHTRLCALQVYVHEADVALCVVSTGNDQYQLSTKLGFSLSGGGGEGESGHAEQS